MEISERKKDKVRTFLAQTFLDTIRTLDYMATMGMNTDIGGLALLQDKAVEIIKLIESDLQEEEEPARRHEPGCPNESQMERDDEHFERGYKKALKEDQETLKDLKKMVDNAYLEGKKEGEKNLSRECDAAHDYGYSKGINDAVQKLHGKP